MTLEPTADFFVSSPTAGLYWPRGGSAHRCSAAARARSRKPVNASGCGAGREGIWNLTFENDKDRRRKTDHAHQVENDDVPRGRKKRGATPEVGQALRAAYQQAVSEDIPPAMLDLLGKLG
jgi:hypothetical protein